MYDSLTNTLCKIRGVVWLKRSYHPKKLLEKYNIEMLVDEEAEDPFAPYNSNAPSGVKVEIEMQKDSDDQPAEEKSVINENQEEEQHATEVQTDSCYVQSDNAEDPQDVWKPNSNDMSVTVMD